MKNKGWAIGIIVAGVLYIGVILFTAAAYFTSLITSAVMSGSGQVLTQDQAVMLTKQASELHYEAVLYTNEALNPDVNKKTYQEWRQDVETAAERWDQLGDVNDLLQYNSGIKITSHKPFGEFFSALSFKKKIWFAGMGEDNLADTLSDFGSLLESDRMLSKGILEESRQSIDEKDWEAENEDMAVMKLNLADLRQKLHVQHADRSYSERDGTIDFKITGTDTVLFFSQDAAYIISNAGSGDAFSANTNTNASLWKTDGNEEDQYVLVPNKVLFLKTADSDNPAFLEKKTEELFKKSYLSNQLYAIDVVQEINEKNNGAVNKKDTSATVEDENKDAAVTEEVQAETETTPEVDDSQEENDSANVLPPGFNTEVDEDTAETAEQSEVVFVDSAFENMMRLALNKNSGAITQTDLDGIRQLIIAGDAFAWVNGDERYSLDYFGQDSYCINGEKYSNKGTITRLDDLAKFSNLEDLTIIYNDIRNIDGIGDAPALENVDLSVNTITDISPIYRSQTLRTINVGLNATFGEQDNEQIEIIRDAFRVYHAARYLGTVACGYGHTLGVTQSGGVLSVGEKSSNDKLDVEGWRNIVMVAAGKDHSVGLKSDGTVVAVGSNKSFGQCNVTSWMDIVMIAAGEAHTVGLKKDGTVVATGLNSEGQCDVSEWRDIIMVAAGSFHTVGLKSDGTVVAVGHNGNGRSNLTGWEDIVAVACGSKHTVGLRSDGTVVAKGWADKYQLNVDRWKNIVAISAGEQYTVGLTAEGSVEVAGNISTRLSKESKVKAVFGGPLNVILFKEDNNFYGYGDNTYGKNNVSNWSDSILIE